MKAQQSLIITTMVALAMWGGAGLAQAESVPHHHAMTTQVAENQETHEGYGVLKAVNIKDHKVQIAHEAIATLQWPAMTMWFTLRTSLPANIKPGDEVRFRLARVDGKTWVITKIGRR